MRQRILSLSIILLALLTSGWGGVIAAAFCLHDAKQQQSSPMAQDHECCRAKLEQPPEHCDGGAPESSHEAMAMSETEAAPAVAKGTEEAAGFGQNDAGCFHCVSRKGLPTVFIVAREPEQKKREASLPAPSTPKLFVPIAASFAPTPLTRQGAPPGSAARRHLLLNIFVI